MAASKSRASDGDPPDGRSHVEGGARKRIKYTDEMKLILEESFQKSMFPPRETRMALAEATGISLEQVTVWFQNRRSGRNAAGVIAASLGAAAAKNKDYDMIGGSGAGGLRDNKEGSSSREDLVGGRPDVKAELLSAEQLRERNGSPSSGGGGSYVCGTYGKGSAKGGGGGGGGGGGSSTSRVGGGELPGGGGPGELSRVGGKIVVGGYHDQQGHSHHPHAAPHIPIVSVSHLHYHNNSQSRGGGGGSVPAVEDTPPPHSSRLLPPVPSPPETAGGGVVPGIPGKPARSSSPFGGGGSVSTNRVLAPGASASLPGTGGGLLLSAKMEPEGSSILGGAGFDPVATFASRVYPTPTGSGAGAACLSAAAAAREGSPGPGSTAVALAGGYQTVMMRGRLGTPEARQQQPLGASTGSNSGVGGSNSKIEMDASGGAVVGSGTHLVYSKLPLGIGISSSSHRPPLTGTTTMSIGGSIGGMGGVGGGSARVVVGAGVHTLCRPSKVSAGGGGGGASAGAGGAVAMRGGASGQGSSKHGEDGGAGGSQGKNPKFNRLRLTDAQKAILEAAFAMGAFPPRELRIELSQKTNMTMEQISTWFQNRRMRLKKPDPSAAQHGGASQTMRSTTVVGGIVPLTTRNHTSGPSPPSGVNSNHQALTNTNSSIKQGLMVPNLNQGANNHTSPHHNENHHGGTVVAFPSSGAGAGTFRHTQAISDMAMRSGEECKDGRSGGEVVGSPALCSTPNSNPTSTGSGLGAGGVSGNNSGGVRGGGGGGNVGGVGAGGIHSLSSERLNPLLRVHKTAIGQPATSPVPLWIPTLAQAQAAAAAAATAAAAEEAEILTSATAAAVSAAAQAGSNVLRHVPSADNTSTAPEGCLASTLVPPAPPPPPAGDSNNVGTRQPPRLPLFSASSLSMSAVVGPIGTPSLSMITSTITTTTLPASSSSSCSASYSISLATSSATAAMVAPLTRTTPVVGGSSERQNVSGPASPSLPRAALVDPSAAALPPAGPQSSLPPTTIASSAKERTSPRHRLLLGSGSGSSLVLSPRLAESAATPVESAATPVEQQRAPDVTPSELNGPMETPDLVPRDESHVGSLGTTGYDKAEGPSPAAGESREQEAVYFSCSAATPAPAAAESKKSIAEGAVGPGSVGSSSPVRMGRPPRISLGLSSVSAAIAPLPPVYSDSACSLPPEVPSLLVHVSTNVHRTLLSRGSALAAQPAATSKDIAAAHAGACAPSSPSVHTSVPAASTSPQAVQIPAASPRSSPTTTVQPLLPSSFATPPISSLAHLDETRHADAASPPPAVETLSAVGKSPPCVVSKSAVQRDGPPPLLVVSPTAPPPPPPPVLATRGLISSLSSDVPAPISPAQENDRKSPQTIVRSPLGHQAMIPVPVSVEGDGARDRQGREKEMDMAVEVTVPHEELPAAATAGRKAGEEYGCGERARGEVSPSHQAASSPSVKPASSPRPNHPVPSAGSPILDRKQEEDGNEEVLPVFRGGNNEAVNVKDRSDGDAFVGVSGSGEHVVKGGRAPAGGEGGGGEAKRVEGDTKGGGYFDLTMTDGGATQQEVKEVAALASLMQREVGKAEQEWGGIRQWCGEGGQQGREEKEEGELDDDEEEEEEERRRLMHDSLRSPEGESNTLLASKDEELGGEGTEGEEQLQLELGKPELSSDGDQEGHRRRLDRDQGEHRQRIEFSLRANSE